MGGAGCPEKRGAYLRVDLWRQPPSSGWRGKSTIDTSSRPMMIDDDDESVGPAGTPKTTSWTRAAYASSSADSLGMFIDSCPSCPPWPVSCFVSFILSTRGSAAY